RFLRVIGEQLLSLGRQLIHRLVVADEARTERVVVQLAAAAVHRLQQLALVYRQVHRAAYTHVVERRAVVAHGDVSAASGQHLQRLDIRVRAPDLVDELPAYGLHDIRATAGECRHGGRLVADDL